MALKWTATKNRLNGLDDLVAQHDYDVRDQVGRVVGYQYTVEPSVSKPGSGEWQATAHITRNGKRFGSWQPAHVFAASDEKYAHAAAVAWCEAHAADVKRPKRLARQYAKAKASVPQPTPPIGEVHD